jgi:hypothetical protein
MGPLTSVAKRLGDLVDRIDKRIDKPAKSRGSFTSGSEQMIDSDVPSAWGRSTSNRRSGYGRGR